MTAGLGLFCLSLIDAMVTLARGGEPAHHRAETRTETGK